MSSDSSSSTVSGNVAITLQVLTFPHVSFLTPLPHTISISIWPVLYGKHHVLRRRHSRIEKMDERSGKHSLVANEAW